MNFTLDLDNDSTPCQPSTVQQPSANPEALTALMPLRCPADGPLCHEDVYEYAVLASGRRGMMRREGFVPVRLKGLKI